MKCFIHHVNKYSHSHVQYSTHACNEKKQATIKLL